MSVLTENIVLSRTRAQDLNSVRKLNCWGSELTDVSLVRRMPYVEVLSLSVNSISTLLDFSFCKNLQELYIRKNCITDLNEVVYLKDLPRLKSLWLADNPCAECDHYRMTVLRALPNLQKLDNMNVQPQEVELAKTKGKTLIEPSEKSDENSDEQIIPVQTQTAHIKKEKIEEVVKPVTDKNQNQDTEDSRRNSQSSPNQIFENAVPKQTKALSPPKPEPIIRDPEERETSVQNQQYIHNQQLKQQQQEATVHRQMTTSVTEQRERVSTNSVTTNSSSATSSSQHINHAFYARVQTLVDHSGRKPRKPSDLRCEGRSIKSATSSPPPPLPSNGIDESPDNFHLADIEGQYYGSGGPGARDLAELETRSCSLDSEASYYLEQRSAVGSGGTASRMDKNSPTRILPKGGRNRNSNILSAVLCLIKELDFASLEVVETAIHCQMEDMEHPLYRP